MPTFGGHRISLWSIIQNAVPNFANDARSDVDMSRQQMDDMLKFQLILPQPRYLDPEALKISGVVDHPKMAKSVYKALVKHGFVTPAPEQGTAAPPSPMTVNTWAIDKKFASRMAIISIHAQRKLVGLLFFWEEECNRWRILDQEENEILQALATAGGQGSQDLTLRLEAVRRKKTLLPSQRAEGASTVFPAMQEDLPAYR